jgi:hypothetical protein
MRILIKKLLLMIVVVFCMSLLFYLYILWSQNKAEQIDREFGKKGTYDATRNWLCGM